MLVILLVTGNTRRIRVLEGGSHVALLAFDAGVLAEQRETGQAVIDLGHLPVALVVTAFTLPALLAFVLVVFLVTGDTGGFELVLEQESRVATVALGLDMLAAQDKFCVAAVIKFHGLPAFFHVAELALSAKAALVTFTVIVGFMTRHARCFELVPEQEPGMAAVALGLDVLATQDEFGVAAVDEGRNAPIFFRVAGFALLAKTTFVTFTIIVGLVTGDTGSFQLFLE